MTATYDRSDDDGSAAREAHYDYVERRTGELLADGIVPENFDDLLEMVAEQGGFRRMIAAVMRVETAAVAVEAAFTLKGYLCEYAKALAQLQAADEAERMRF